MVSNQLRLSQNVRGSLIQDFQLLKTIRDQKINQSEMNTYGVGMKSEETRNPSAAGDAAGDSAMENSIRQRQIPANTPNHHFSIQNTVPFHPGGEIKHGGIVQVLRLLLIIGYFCSSCAVLVFPRPLYSQISNNYPSIVITQFIGAPFYWVNRKLYYAYMALTKQSFGIFATTLTHWWAPTVIRISGDDSVSGQLRQTVDGSVECKFPERAVLIANHQLYSDWLYLWWVAYTNQPTMHGHIYIILKESLKHVPIIGWGMRFYGFIFMSRKFTTDAPRISHRLRKLKEKHTNPFSGTTKLDPMWLLIFPEGTNASSVGRLKSRAWAEKNGVPDMQHMLHPRSAGLFYCLNELKDTVDFLYDCTLAYEGVKRGEFGQDFYTLRTMFLQGQPPPSVNMYWRRFAVAKIPLDNAEKFNLWLCERWSEKDALIEHYITNGRFPLNTALPNPDSTNTLTKTPFIETQVKTVHWWEVCNIYIILVAFLLVIKSLLRWWDVMGFLGGLSLT